MVEDSKTVEKKIVNNSSVECCMTVLVAIVLQVDCAGSKKRTTATRKRFYGFNKENDRKCLY